MFAPMSQGELLDGAFGLYGRHFKTLVGVAAICNGPGQVLSLYTNVSGGVTERPITYLLALLLAAIGGLIGSAAILKIISDGYLGRESPWPEAIRFAMSKAWPLLVAGFASAMLTGLALLLFVIPGIIVSCGYSVVRQVVVLENLPRATDALGRSWALTKGYRMTAFLIAFVLSLVAAVPSGIAGMLVAFGFGVPAFVLAALAQILLSPLLPCGMTLYYYDLRIRKEAFDLQVLGQLMDGAPA